MKRLLSVFLLAVCLVCTSCASFDKAVATGYGLNIVTRDLSTELLDADRLSSEDGKRIKSVNDRVSAGLFRAWLIRKTSPDSAKAAVKLLRAQVEEIFGYLKKKEAK